MLDRPDFSVHVKNAKRSDPTYILLIKYRSDLNGSDRLALSPLVLFHMKHANIYI